jgi:hypothetical protein
MTLGRFAFHALLPSLLLPVIVTLSALLGGIVNPQGGVNIEWLVIGAFCAVLLGSMALNAWLLLRHTESWRLQALPNGLAVMLVILWGLQVVGAVVVALTRFSPVTVGFGIALMVMSVVVFVAAIARKFMKTAAAPVVAVGLSTYGKALGWGYLVLVALTIVLGLFATISVGPFAAFFALLLVGLPWSWPLAAVGLFSGGLASVLPSIFAILMLASVVFNVIVVVKLLTQPAFRTRFVNWFFKLRGSGDPQTTIRTFAAPEPPTGG